MTYSLDNARSLGGILLILALCWLLSENRKRFPFLLTLGALGLQAGLVLALFALPNSQAALNAVSSVVDGLASATDKGTAFVFGYLGGARESQPFPIEREGNLFIFGFRVLPLILVISALSALLWHWKILKWITQGFGILFQRTMGLTGPSALAVAANIFMGMVESPIVIRAYLDRLTRSELFLMMVVGLATVAGSTMVAYAVILGPTLPNAAGHVLVASIISAPAGILLARIMIPEDSAGAHLEPGDELKYQSSMDAITRGVQDGVMVAVNVAAMLMVFVSFVWIVNNMLAIAGPIDGELLTLQRIFGYVFAPVAYLIGLPWAESQQGGAILGSKLFLTEFIAYIELGAIPADALSERSRMILTYAICGFANVASVGIMTGGMTVLMPQRRNEIFALAWKSLLPGFLATLMAAAVVAALPAGLFGSS
ncbi:MAG TPA: Na+ dependent nucleoside transporter [Hyphomonadaceae bacterium]|nr:Na+ dependent nucleoside transporter [Hyphomonadaceae bacterium]